jgi:hypothetical protein
MATDLDHQVPDYTIRGITTEVVEIEGEPPTRFTRGALEDAARQIRTTFIPMNVEHLGFLPPMARWYEAEVVDRDDGESELILHGRKLPHYVPAGDDPDPLRLVAGLPKTESLGAVAAEFWVEPRNYEASALEQLSQDAPIDVEHHSQRSILPPIEWIITIPVVWGAAQFLGAFFSELGRASAAELVSWLKGWQAHVKQPQRDRLVTLRFDLPDGGIVYGFIPLVENDTGTDQKILSALDSSAQLAGFCGIQRESGVLPDLKRAAFVFAENQWRFAWWTDGDAVYHTRWFDENTPDAARFLGHPPPGQ